MKIALLLCGCSPNSELPPPAPAIELRLPITITANGVVVQSNKIVGVYPAGPVYTESVSITNPPLEPSKAVKGLMKAEYQRGFMDGWFNCYSNCISYAP